MKFADLRLSKPILRAVADQGYSIATPIQAQTIPPAIDGRDVLGCAQTGTGKTAAFALPVLHRLSSSKPDGASKRPRCLVLCPTRELAVQIDDSFAVYGRGLQLRHTVVFGGVNQHAQVRALRRGVDILVATPGRLLDLMNQGHIDLGGIETLVLDEADRMLDMGFIHDINRVVDQIPDGRQTLLFSATMPREIRQLVDRLLDNPATVEVTPVASTVDLIDQSVYFATRKQKPLLLNHLVDTLSISRAIVFTRTKHGADRVVRHLRRHGTGAEAIHGNKTQNARQRALAKFRDGQIHILVATDIASRGIDVDGVSHVINYDLTHEPETYVHRIGRTARAGASGAAVSFCDADERANLKAIQRLIRQEIAVRTDHPDYGELASIEPEPAAAASDESRPKSRRRNRRRGEGTSQNASARHGSSERDQQSKSRSGRGGGPFRRRRRRTRGRGGPGGSGASSSNGASAA